jgi:DNA polymerase-3 subunit alpha
MVAVLNNGGGFYRPEFYIHDARMLGATIHPPCINKSYAINRIYDTHIYLGLMYIRDLEARSMQRFLAERSEKGPFASLEDFIDRVMISREQLSLLIRIDAFRFTGINKHELLWKAHLMMGNETRSEHPKLFGARPQQFRIPSLNTKTLETAFEQMELLGFSLCSPFDLLEERPKNTHGQEDLTHYLNKNIDLYGYLVTVKNTSTHTGKRMFFATFIDQQGEVFDVVLFPPIAKKFPFRGKGIYRVYGKVVSEFGFLSIEVIRMKKENYIPDPRYSDMKTAPRLLQNKDLLKSRNTRNIGPGDE